MIPPPGWVSDEDMTQIPEYSHCRASSVWGNNAIGSGAGQGNLDSPQAWSAGTAQAGEWWQMDLTQPCEIVGVVTRKDLVEESAALLKIIIDSLGLKA